MFGGLSLARLAPKLVVVIAKASRSHVPIEAAFPSLATLIRCLLLVSVFLQDGFTSLSLTCRSLVTAADLHHVPLFQATPRNVDPVAVLPHTRMLPRFEHDFTKPQLHHVDVAW
jgi:hypothetical protein